MAWLSGVIILRSVAWFTLLAFVPLWVVAHGHSKEAATACSSPCSSPARWERSCSGRSPTGSVFGARSSCTQIAIGPLVLVFVYVGGVPGVVALMLVGVCVVGSFGVTMVLSQLYLPRHVGMASGLAVGLAMGIGGIAAVILGAVADVASLKTALTICAIAPAVGVLLCLKLPAPRGASSLRASRHCRSRSRRTAERPAALRDRNDAWRRTKRSRTSSGRRRSSRR